MSTTINHPNPRYMGYCDARLLPIKAGMEVVIPKGTPVCHRGNVVVSKRANTVTVHHVLPGMTRSVYDCKRYYDMTFPAGLNDHVQVPVSNPQIAWAGAGSYWSEVDINYLPSVVTQSPLPFDNREVYYQMAIAADSVRDTSRDMLHLYIEMFLGRGTDQNGFNPQALATKLHSIRQNSENANTVAACDLLLDTYTSLTGNRHAA